MATSGCAAIVLVGYGLSCPFSTGIPLLSPDDRLSGANSTDYRELTLPRRHVLCRFRKLRGHFFPKFSVHP
jgi:hypothetical protein